MSSPTLTTSPLIIYTLEISQELSDDEKLAIIILGSIFGTLFLVGVASFVFYERKRRVITSAV
jgi:hypothetical protein